MLHLSEPICKLFILSLFLDSKVSSFCIHQISLCNFPFKNFLSDSHVQSSKFRFGKYRHVALTSPSVSILCPNLFYYFCSSSHTFLYHLDDCGLQNCNKQECIPEGCVPLASVAILGGVCPGKVAAQGVGVYLRGCLPRGVCPRVCVQRGFCLGGVCLGVYTPWAQR